MIDSTRILITAGVIGCASAASAAEVAEIVVTTHRLPPAASERLLATTVFDSEALSEAGGQRLDEALRTVPGFTLFRRQSSRASHPTTQGVTLRGLGPSGAGRTLVLLDGVPQNDPFGGWIDWSRLPPSALESVSLTRGGGAGAWGNAALAGTIRLSSRVPSEVGANGNFSVNSFGAVDGIATAYAPVGEAGFTVTAGGHTGDGPYLIGESQRGPADVRTKDNGGQVQGTLTLPVGADTELMARGGYSINHYVNGIALAKSRVRTVDGALSLVHRGDPDAIGWEVHAYVRDGNQPAVFSAVDATRSTATPSLDQFKVPATAVGGNLIVRFPIAPTLSVDLGGDIRHATAATHENFTFLAGSFTRVREAGGDQLVAGGYLEANWEPREAVTVSAAARVDRWRQSDGRRIETIRATGVVARNDRYPTRTGTVSNFRLGARVDVSPAVTLRASGYTGFRIPTLNELYRPFRVGNDITEANPNLRPERLYGAEGGIRWQANDALSFEFTAFVARLRHAVGNVTIRDTPGLDPGTGVVVPAGGVLRQRQNIDRITAEGVEGEIRWIPSDGVQITARYLYTSPRISRSLTQPALQGLALAQVAKHQGTLAVTWRPWEGGLLRAEGLATSHQFEDDQNTRRLAGYATLDLYAEQAIGRGIAVYVSGDNLFDRTIEAGRSAAGLITVGAPRTFTAGVRVGL